MKNKFIDDWFGITCFVIMVLSFIIWYGTLIYIAPDIAEYQHNKRIEKCKAIIECGYCIENHDEYKYCLNILEKEL